MFIDIHRPCVLVFAGHDPSGGAGIQADSEAIAAQGAHALTVITALTVQDNNQVETVYPVDANIIKEQALKLIQATSVSAVKIGIVGNRMNADTIADIIKNLLVAQPTLHVILDPVLSSGRGNELGQENPISNLQPLLQLASVITPNLPEAKRFYPDDNSSNEQAKFLLKYRCRDVLIKGGHSEDEHVNNEWFSLNHEEPFSWHWDRLQGEFHGSGCTLASALAAQLALRKTMQDSLQLAQEYTQKSLKNAYSIAQGQKIPCRLL